MKSSRLNIKNHKVTKKHKVTKNHKVTKKHKQHKQHKYFIKKQDKTHNKKHNKKYNKKSYKGGVKEMEGFIIEVDELNMPVENSLDFENAEIFLVNFLFNDNFIKTYLEKDSKSLSIFLKSPEIKLYSGDETQLDNLIEDLISKNMNLFLKLYKIVDVKSYNVFIKDLYKQPTMKPITIGDKEQELVSVTTGGTGPGDVYINISPGKSPNLEDLYKIEEQGVLKKKLFTAVRGVMNFGIHVAVGVSSTVINIIRQKIQQAPEEAIPEAMPAPMPAAERIVDWSERRHVCVFNVSGTLQPFITKISTDPQFIDSYAYEYSLYDKLRRKPIIKPNELENFFNFQRTDAVTVYGPIIINLDFSMPGGKQLIKPINLRNYTAPNNITMYSQFGRINWCAMNGTFNPLHYDYSVVMDDTSIFTINKKQDKIIKSLSLIFDNLNYFYTTKGFSHCDFKLNNILVRLNESRENIVSAIMFDLDFSIIMPSFVEGKTTRSQLDGLKIPLNPSNGGRLNNYLNAEMVGLGAFTGGFCHFFDCYFSAMSFFTTVLNNKIAKDSVINLPWNSNPLHAINIFKACYLLINLYDKEINTINTPHYGGQWGTLRLENILPVILYSIKSEQFVSLSKEQKIVLKWIWKNLRDCDIKPFAVNLTNTLNVVLSWPA
jgi:hypothetical protein